MLCCPVLLLGVALRGLRIGLFVRGRCGFILRTQQLPSTHLLDICQRVGTVERFFHVLQNLRIHGFPFVELLCLTEIIELRVNLFVRLRPCVLALPLFQVHPPIGVSLSIIIYGESRVLSQRDSLILKMRGLCPLSRFKVLGGRKLILFGGSVPQIIDKVVYVIRDLVGAAHAVRSAIKLLPVLQLLNRQHLLLQLLLRLNCHSWLLRLLLQLPLVVGNLTGSLVVLWLLRGLRSFGALQKAFLNLNEVLVQIGKFLVLEVLVMAGGARAVPMGKPRQIIRAV